MLRVGLTGGIACGKSTVARMFQELGAQVIDADVVVHELYRPGQEVYQELVQRFGQEIVKANGEIDRGKLAAAAFDGGRVEELNRVVHPAVIRQQEEWMRKTAAEDPDALVIVEAALILEAGAGGRFDKIIVVTCRPEQKIERLARRAGLGDNEARAEVKRRTKAQFSDEEKARRADYLIDNCGALEATRAQVQRIFAELKQLSKGGV
jgi:dephospho-CoA kinase